MKAIITVKDCRKKGEITACLTFDPPLKPTARTTPAVRAALDALTYLVKKAKGES